MEPPISKNGKRAQPSVRGSHTPAELSRVIRLPLKQRFCYGLGHVINDLSAYAAFSYVLVFWTKVVGIKHTSAGIIFLIAQVGDAISSPFIGYMCDRFRVPLFSRIGRRKGWHLMGTILMLLSNPLIFGRCFLCAAGDSAWLAVIYYSVITISLQIGFASVQISHLSLLSEIARKPSQAVELNSIRATFTFLSGIFIYGVTWILLDDSNGGKISPDQWKEFLHLGLILVGIGAFTSLMFYIGVEEPPSEVIDRNTEDSSVELGISRPDLPPAADQVQMPNNDGTQVVSVNRESAVSSYARDRELGIENTALATEDEATNDCTDARSRGPRTYSCTDVSSRDNEMLNKTSCDQKCEFSFSNELFEKEVRICEVNDGPDGSTEQAQHGAEKGEAKAGKTHWQWFRMAGFYQISVVYMCSRLVMNVSNSYFPLFLIDALQFEKEAIAYFPLVALVSGVILSTATKKINKILGSKISFCGAAAAVIGACVWYYKLTLSNRNLVYGAAIMMGSGTSVISITSLAMVNDFIGSRKESSAFVYGLLSFVDKLAAGTTIAGIQEFYPQECDRGRCAAYVRLAFSMTCGIAASLAFLIVALSKPRIVCRVQAETATKETQTEAVSMATNSKQEQTQSFGTSDTRM